MLDENEIKVYNSMKPNVPVLPDELAHGDMSVSDIMSSLTILEMAGAVESNLNIRKEITKMKYIA